MKREKEMETVKYNMESMNKKEQELTEQLKKLIIYYFGLTETKEKGKEINSYFQ